MRPWGTLGIGLVVSLIVATPAAAQGGGGLYEPFPEPAPTGQVRNFIAKLPADGKRLESDTTAAELERGRFPSATLRPRPGSDAASRRAGVGTGAALLEGWAGAIAALAAAAACAVALARRRA